MSNKQLKKMWCDRTTEMEGGSFSEIIIYSFLPRQLLVAEIKLA